MNKWINRLFGILDEKPELPSVPVNSALPVADLPAVCAPPAELQHAHIDIDAIFCRWLIGCNSSSTTGPGILEKTILDALDALSKSKLAGANLVPRVPAIIPQLLKSLRDEHISAGELSHQIAHDVILIAEVIREANSPYYHPAKPITNLENAVLILGQNGLRLLIARVAFRPIINMQSGHFTNLAAPHIWTQSEKCADTCSRLATEMKADPFVAFLAGLVQNVGMIVAFRLIDRLYDGNALPGSDEFCRALTVHARVLSALIGRQWDFPEEVVNAIENMSKGLSDSDKAPLHEILSISDRVSKIRLLVDNNLLGQDQEPVLNGLSDTALRCFSQLKPLPVAA
jgi:HD-like signal output (HDOD) protein